MDNSNTWVDRVKRYAVSQFLPPMTLNPLLGDYLIHNTPLYNVSNTVLMDGVWNAFNGSFLSWVISSKDSDSIIRQTVAGANRYHRYSSTRTISFIDYLLSLLISQTNLSITHFSPEKSLIRAARRFNLTCQRNGGIYLEKKKVIAEIIKAGNLIPENIDFEKDSTIRQILNLNQELPKTDNSISNQCIKLFEKEFDASFATFFEKFNLISSKITDGVCIFNASLKGGVPVSVTVFLPREMRMQFIDSIPATITKYFLECIPFTGSISGFTDALQQRAYFALKNESDVRTALLTRLGVKFEGSPQEIVENVEKVDFPFDIAVPIPKLTTKHFMITSRIPTESPKIIAKEWVYKLAEGTARALFDHNILIPNVSSSNIVSAHGKCSLLRFSGGCTPNPAFLNNASKLFIAKVTNNKTVIPEIAKSMGVGFRKLDTFVNQPTFWNALPLCRKYAPEMLGITEMFSGLINNARSAGLDGQIFEPFAKKICEVSPQSNVTPNLIIDYMNNIVSTKFE